MAQDRGPTFPASIVWDMARGDGLTLRDYFAAMAMEFARAEAIKSSDDGDDWAYADVAEAAYLMADAMLKERAK